MSIFNFIFRPHRRYMYHIPSSLNPFRFLITLLL